MRRGFTIPFIFAALLLALFEHIFLEEIFSDKRVLILAGSFIGALLAALLIIRFLAKYLKA